MPDLYRALTLHLPDGADRQQVGRLVEAMCRLNGIPAAIEMHATERDSSPPRDDTRDAPKSVDSGRDAGAPNGSTGAPDA